jgi:hypothetical protein
MKIHHNLIITARDSNQTKRYRALEQTQTMPDLAQVYARLQA